ncbi:hypothetical protein Aperf_G00000031987 [Anoplocephala perfoliata]
MELQVFVNGKPRDVCGVDDNTSAEEVVAVLCQSLHLSGSYCLVAYWQKNEIVFSPSESPLNIIRRVGDHPKQFQFVLRRIDVNHPLNPSRTRSPGPTSHHHRRISSTAAHCASFQNAATSYNHPRDRSFQRPEDKEVAAAFAGRNSEQEAAELQRLSMIDWSRSYETENQRYHTLIEARSRLQSNLQRLDVDLRQVRGKVQGLESEMAGQLTNLLNLVEKALEVRRKTLSDHSSAAEAPLPQSPLPPTHVNKSAPVCDEVLI